MQVDNGVERDISLFGLLAYQLAVDLTLGGDVDEQVAPDGGLATQAPSVVQGSFSFAVFLFGEAEWREMFLFRGNSQFRETSLGAYYLAAPTEAAAAADGINIDA